jgi:manganese-dependent inorganic pyrophosphatase
MPTLVIGHRNPDTDAICSALAYAQFLRTIGDVPDAEAACCGEINARTKFALEQCHLAPPRLVMDVRPTLADVARRDVVSAREDEPVFTVFNRMRDRGFRSLPVIDGGGRLRGLVSLSKLVELLLPLSYDVGQTRIVETSLHRLTDVIGGQVLHAERLEEEQALILTIAALSAKEFESRLWRYDPQRLLVVCGDRPTVQRPAIEYGARAIVITGGCSLDPDLLARARQRGVTIITSPHDTAATTILIKCAKRIDLALDSDPRTFPANTLLKSVAPSVRESNQPLFPVLDIDEKLAGVFSKSDLLNPPRPPMILVDHNEFAQAVNGIEEAQIIEVIDHHRLGGGLTSREPIRFINEPVGSTCTIVARMFRDRGLNPGRDFALCLCSGIISDTLHLTSPTTTPLDHDILGWLRTSYQLDLCQFAESFFAAGSALQVSAPAEIVAGDCKEYSENGWRLAIAQVEELGFERFWPRETSLAGALAALREERGLDLVCLLITDISTHTSYLLGDGQSRLLDAIDYPRLKPGLWRLDGVVSRKKQLLPHLAQRLAAIPRE